MKYVLYPSPGRPPGQVAARAQARLARADFVRNLGDEDRPFHHGLAAQRCDRYGVAVGDATKPPRRPLGVIWSPNPWGALHFCDDCTDLWHDLVDDPAAGATAFLSITAISRRRRSRGKSLRRA